MFSRTLHLPNFTPRQQLSLCTHWLTMCPQNNDSPGNSGGSRHLTPPTAGETRQNQQNQEGDHAGGGITIEKVSDKHPLDNAPGLISTDHTEQPKGNRSRAQEKKNNRHAGKCIRCNEAGHQWRRCRATCQVSERSRHEIDLVTNKLRAL